MNDTVKGNHTAAESDVAVENAETATLANSPIDFLQAFHPDGPWCLTVLDPEQKAGAVTATFSPQRVEQAAAFIDAWNGKRNLYFSVNMLREAMSKKAKATDITALAYLHVDIDPRTGEDLDAERSRIEALLTRNLPEGVPQPTAIVFSGGGYQAFWRLKEPLPLDGSQQQADDAKLWNLALERKFQADSCHNIDRIMRLAGTMNLPNAKKIAKGRGPAMARLVDADWSRIYDISAFEKAPATHGFSGAELASATEAEKQAISSLDELDRWNVSDRIKAAIEFGADADRPKSGDNSRSGWEFDVACQLVRSGVPQGVIVGILLDARWGISASVLEKGRKAEKYACRQADRAAKFVSLDTAEFQRDQDNNLLKNQHNLRLAIHKLGINLSFNTFHDRFIVNGLRNFGPVIDDAAMIRLRLLIDENFKWLPAKEFFEDVVKDTARKHSFHPVRDYLDELAWDGVPRIDRWLSTYFGAKASPYTNAVGRLWLVAAVRRVREPGCKFDEMIVLESDQGKDKSTALAVLAVKEEWFTDNLPLNADSARTIESISGRWIIEVAELQGGRKSEVEHVKAMLSRRIDRARLAYGRLPTEYPRQCVFAGTTNNQKYLRDQTGNRRFWPVAVGKIDISQLKRDRDQLWAEAAAFEAEGESIRLDPALWQDAAVEQDQRREDDPFLMSLSEYLETHTGKIRVTEVFELLGLPMHMRTTDQNTRVGMAMKALGWEHVQRRFGGNPEWAYVKGTQEQRQRRLKVMVCDGQRYVSTERDEAVDDKAAKVLPF